MSGKAPDPLALLFDRMQRKGLDLNVDGLLDALWLAQQPGLKLDVPRPAAGALPGAGEGGDTRDAGLSFKRSSTVPPRSEPKTPGAARPAPDKDESIASGVFAGLDLAGEKDTLPASPLRIPAGSALAGKLALSRALRPLRKWYRNARTLCLDEAATVEETAAAGGVLIPVMQAAAERWYELAIVADTGASMDVWQETLTEFESMTRAAGAFRDIRRFRLVWRPSSGKHVEDAAFLENADGTAVRASGLAQTNVRRLVLVATNGSADYWSDGRMAALLRLWSAHCSVALVHMLPRSMWPRTRTGEPKLLLRTLVPGAVTRSLDAEAREWEADLTDDEGRPRKRVPGAIPILPLDAAWMSRWARMQMGGGQRVPAVAVGRRAESAARSTPEKTAGQWERAVRAFTLHASLEARQLAVYLSSGAFTLPVARVAQAAKFGSAASQTQLAEILLSGLVERISKVEGKVRPEQVGYRFHPLAAEILRRGLRESDAREIARALEKHIEKYWGKPVAFQALVYDEEGQLAIPAWAKPFVQLGGSLLGLPSHPEPPDDGRPTVFVMWETPAWRPFGHYVIEGLKGRNFRVLISGRHKVPFRGVLLIIGENSPFLRSLAEDCARAIEHGLDGLFLLPPGVATPAEIWMLRWDEYASPEEAFEKIGAQVTSLSQQPAPPVTGVPPLDREHGLSPFAAELDGQSGISQMVVYSNQDFDGLATVRDLAWLRDTRMPFSGGVHWIKFGDRWEDRGGQLLIFEKWEVQPYVPEGCGYILLDPAYPVVAGLPTALTYEGSDEVKQQNLARWPPAEVGLPGLRSPHLEALFRHLEQSRLWEEVRPAVEMFVKWAADAKYSVPQVEKGLRTAIFDAIPTPMRDAAGMCAVLQHGAPRHIVNGSVSDELSIDLQELDLFDSSNGRFTATETARTLARHYLSWPSWNERVLARFGNWREDWYHLAEQDDYVRGSLLEHAVQAGHPAFALSVLCDFRWWFLRLSRDGDAEFEKDLFVFTEEPTEVAQIRSFFPSARTEATIGGLVRLIMAFDGDLPPQLRTSAKAFIPSVAGPGRATPERFILIAGSRDAGTDTPASRPVLWTAAALGAEIARRGLGLVCGVQPGADQAALNAFLAQMQRRQTPPAGALRIVTFEPPASGVNLPQGVPVFRSEDQVVDSVRRADVVVLLGGADWVKRVYHEARAQNKPVFPIPGTGDAAVELFLQDLRAGTFKGSEGWVGPALEEVQAERLARELLDAIAVPPEAEAPASYPEKLRTEWERYLEPATDDRPLFDWRSRTPDLASRATLQLIQSPDTAERIIGFTGFWAYPKPDIVIPVVRAAVDGMEQAESLTDLYIRLGICNLAFLEANLFPGAEVAAVLESILEKLHLRLPARGVKRARDARERVQKLDRQLEIWFAVSSDPESKDLGRLAPPYGRYELQNHLKRGPGAELRSYAYAVLTREPDASLTENLIACLVEREDRSAAFGAGLRALEAIVRGHPLDPAQWDRLQAIRPRLAEALWPLLESLRAPQAR